MSLSADTLAGKLTARGHELLQRVYYEDTDFSGRVYHARYLHFLERGRTDFLRLLGIGHTDLLSRGLAFVVRHMEIDFLRAARIDDVLCVCTRPHSISGASMLLAQTIWRGADEIVSARPKIALIDRSGKPVRLPAEIRRALDSDRP